MEPSLPPMNQLNLSADENDSLPTMERNPDDLPNQVEEEIGNQFEQNASNVSFG